MALATIRLIEAVERLNMTGEIGDGTVANLHELATMARLEVVPHVGFLEWAREQVEKTKPVPVPSLGDLVTLSPDTLATLRSRALHAGGPLMPRAYLEREGPESFYPITTPTRADIENQPERPDVGSLPMRHQCNCECHRTPRVAHVAPCCR